MSIENRPGEKSHRPVTGGIYLLAVDSSGFGFYAAYLGSVGSLGHAVGLLGWHVATNAAVDLGDVATPFIRTPWFVEGESLSNGRWRYIGRRDHLLGLFSEPAMYHHPTFDLSDRGLLPFGVAEYADGRERKLGRAESAEVFGEPIFYQQLWPDEELEVFVRETRASALSPPQSRLSATEAEADERFHPFRLRAAADGQDFELTLHDNDMAQVAPVFHLAGREGNGYSWADVAMSSIRRDSSELEQEIRLEPEGGDFVAYSADLAGLCRLAAGLHAAFHDQERLSMLLKSAPYSHE